MKSSTKLYRWCLFCFVPALLFRQASAPNDVVPEEADKAASQVSTASALQSVTPQAMTDHVELEKMVGLRAFVGQYCAAYAKKDVNAVMALWSSQSPELTSYREALQKFFAAHEKICAIRNMRIRSIRLDSLLWAIRTERGSAGAPETFLVKSQGADARGR